MEDLKNFYDAYFDTLTIKQCESIWQDFVCETSFLDSNLTKEELINFIEVYGDDIETSEDNCPIFIPSSF